MDPKEYMKQTEHLRKRIRRKENEISVLRQIADGMTGKGGEEVPKTETPDMHKLEAAVCKIISLEQELEVIRCELDLLISKMKLQINGITDKDAKDLLEKRYVEFKPWKIISIEIGYSIQHTYLLHGKALEKLRVDKSI